MSNSVSTTPETDGTNLWEIFGLSQPEARREIHEALRLEVDFERLLFKCLEYVNTYASELVVGGSISSTQEDVKSEPNEQIHNFSDDNVESEPSAPEMPRMEKVRFCKYLEVLRDQLDTLQRLNREPSSQLRHGNSLVEYAHKIDFLSEIGATDEMTMWSERDTSPSTAGLPPQWAALLPTEERVRGMEVKRRVEGAVRRAIRNELFAQKPEEKSSKDELIEDIFPSDRSPTSSSNERKTELTNSKEDNFPTRFSRLRRRRPRSNSSAAESPTQARSLDPGEEQELQDQLTDEVVELSEALKASAVAMRGTLTRDEQSLEHIDTLVDSNIQRTGVINKRMQKHLDQVRRNLCSSFGMYLMVFLLFALTFFIIKLFPKR
eukprot:191148_1